MVELDGDDDGGGGGWRSNGDGWLDKWEAAAAWDGPVIGLKMKLLEAISSDQVTNSQLTMHNQGFPEGC